MIVPSLDGAEYLVTGNWWFPSQMASEDHRPSYTACLNSCFHSGLLVVCWEGLTRRQNTRGFHWGWGGVVSLVM